MNPFVIALIVILAVHYVLSIATVYLLLKDMGLKKAIIPWNLTILLLPIVGPVIYLIYRPFRKNKNAHKGTEEFSNGHEDSRE